MLSQQLHGAAQHEVCCARHEDPLCLWLGCAASCVYCLWCLCPRAVGLGASGAVSALSLHHQLCNRIVHLATQPSECEPRTVADAACLAGLLVWVPLALSTLALTWSSLGTP